MPEHTAIAMERLGKYVYATTSQRPTMKALFSVGSAPALYKEEPRQAG
jgi:hypothetical protein